MARLAGMFYLPQPAGHVAALFQGYFIDIKLQNAFFALKCS